MTFGMTLKKQREIKNLSQKDMGEKLEVHSQFISNIELNKAPLPPKYFRTVSEVLGISVSKLVDMHLAAEKKKVMEQI